MEASEKKRPSILLFGCPGRLEGSFTIMNRQYADDEVEPLLPCGVPDKKESKEQVEKMEDDLPVLLPPGYKQDCCD